MSEWQPIETAPKDGSRFIFTNGDDVIGTGMFISGKFFSADSWQGSLNTIPTHWMPLPDLPTAQ